MIYTDPSNWNHTAKVVHNAMADVSIFDNDSRIVSGAEGHEIISIVNALNGAGELVDTQTYASRCADRMADGSISGSAYGSAASFLARIDQNWSGRGPGLMNWVRDEMSSRDAPYKVLLDGEYAHQDGLREEFTQVPLWNNSAVLSIKVSAGTLDDVAFLGLGGVEFDGGDGDDLVSYRNTANRVIVSGDQAFIQNMVDADVLSNVETMEGGQGNDQFITEAFTSILGLGGDDEFVFMESSTSQVYDGGEGADRLDFSSCADRVAIEFMSGQSVARTPSSTLRFASMEEVIGTGEDDVFWFRNAVSDAGVKKIRAGDGLDTLDLTGQSAALIWDVAAASHPDGSGNADLRAFGVEVLIGSQMNDEFRFKALAKWTNLQRLDGGDGIDTLVLPGGGSVQNAADHVIDLEAGLLGADTVLVSIENVIAGSGFDVIKGDSGKNVFFGAGNPDHIDGRGGDDEIYGSGLNDTLIGGDGDDRIEGRGGHDLIDAGDGHDFVVGGGYADTITGGLGADTIYGGDEVDPSPVNYDYGDSISGGAGADHIWGGIGDNWLYGDEGDDHIYGGRDRDRIFGGDGDDYAEAAAGGDVLQGGLGNDTLRGGAGYDLLEGGDGNDVLIAGADNDTIRGGGGNDEIRGDAGHDSLYGGSGADVFFLSSGQDIIFDFEFGLDKLYDDGFAVISYNLRSLVGDLQIITATSMMTIKDEDIGDRFRSLEYGEDRNAWNAQFSVLWGDPLIG